MVAIFTEVRTDRLIIDAVVLSYQSADGLFGNDCSNGSDRVGVDFKQEH